MDIKEVIYRQMLISNSIIHCSYDSLKCRTQGVSMVICNTLTLIIFTIVAILGKSL